jgi:hypothetical protein
MASAIVSSTKKSTARQIEAAAAIYKANSLATAKQFEKIQERADRDYTRALAKAGLKVTEKQIQEYLARQPLSAEALAKRESLKKQGAINYLEAVDERLGDLCAMAEALEGDKLDDVGKEAIGRLLFLNGVRAAQELEAAAECLGVEFTSGVAPMGKV